ncbi:DUF4230 domain-containing protein [Qipengyuania sp. XHP0207]|uniref:DUF4230 domain-containing protein n=1 Tax=Qipengyuania sp. XHP0207 TaxID=3038078 RepID=UPI00241C4EB6|nr:DUF4230 domain-containing protein [Qipengyuania sp. XHP0207]MDG5749207.1 DUF4230 domain-containing protein [Qipengyuania sp. XHP0207]
MANDLKTRENTVQPEVTRDRPLARVQAVPWLIVIALLAAVAWLGWRAFVYEEEGDPVGSAMLAFEKQNSLTVFSSRFEVVAESVDNRGPFGQIESRQAVIVPASVEYRLDLGEMDRDDFTWNAETSRLTVTLPQLQTSRPNLDEARARVYTEGLYVSRDASADLARNNSQQAERKASAFAKNREILELARTAAKQAVRQNLAIPLQVAGYDEITVDVRFANEPTPDA